MTRPITVPHLARVEGHGRIKVEIADGKVTDVRFNIFESPRFFEAVVRGRRYDEIPEMVCRICAICSAGHKVTSLMAVERAAGIRVSKQTELLRELYYHGMFIESHVLHLYFLALPDYLGYGSVVELAPKYQKEVSSALAMKKLGNRIQELVSGRPVHGPNAVVGGFGKVPSEGDLRAVRQELENLFPAAQAAVHLFSQLDYPEFTRAFTVFFAVKPSGDLFSYFGDSIACSTGDEIPLDNYQVVCDERVLAHSTAKHSYSKGEPFMVGALARVNLFHRMLTPVAKSLLRKIGWSLPSNNTLHNNLAQAVEVVYSFERAMQIIDTLLKEGVTQEEPVRPAADAFKRDGGARGIAATEVPRGTLYHDYVFDEEGRLTWANVVTPTAQNAANVERDLRNCAQSTIHKDDEEIRLCLEMVARAYDPCISCSAHLIELVRR